MMSLVRKWRAAHHYKIGTKSYPAYLTPAKTNSMDAVETSITVEYDTLTPVM